jgi:hypothetical protein
VAQNAADCELGDEPATALLERRWFAMLSAIGNLQAECGVLMEASKLAEMAWRRACVQLAEFEALRDVLEEQMSKPAPARRPRQTNAA